MLTFKKVLFAILIFLFHVLILDHLPLSYGVQINLFIYIILCLIPFNMNKTSLILIAFLIGLLRDSFTFTYGLYAFGAIVIIFIQHYYFLLPQYNKLRKIDTPLYANSNLLGWRSFLIYITIFSTIFTFLVNIINYLTTWIYIRFYFIIEEIFFTIIFICIAELMRSWLFHKEEKEKFV